MECLEIPIFFQLAVESGLTDAEQPPRLASIQVCNIAIWEHG